MAQAKEKANALLATRNFFSEVYAESKKIVWPTRETLIQSTLVVLVVIVALSIFMAIADGSLSYFFNKGLPWIGQKLTGG